MSKLAFFLLLAGPLFAADLAIQVSAETVPPGAYAQFKISLAAPQPVASGRIVMDFDPAVFGDIASVAVFSAAGDAYGVAATLKQHLDAQFTSPSGGVGRLPGLPVLVVSIPVLPTAAAGITSAITVDPSQSPWTDPEGNSYSVSATNGSLTVGGALSVQGVTPGGGLLPAGTMVRITGAGFTSSTSVLVDGVSVSSVKFIGSQEMDFTFGAPAELTGKRIVLRNPDGSEVQYFSCLGGPPLDHPVNGFSSFLGVQPLFPLATQRNGVGWASAPLGGWAMGLQNPNLEPVEVKVGVVGLGRNFSGNWTAVTISPGASYLYETGTFSTLLVDASAPLRMVWLSSGTLYAPRTASLVGPGLVPPPQAVFSLPEVVWRWQVGTATPSPATEAVSGTGEPVDFAVQASTYSGGSWLAVTPTHGNTAQPTTLTVTVNPSGLGPGTYSGSITAITSPRQRQTPHLPRLRRLTGGFSSELPVFLSVTPALDLVSSPSGAYFAVLQGVAAPAPQTMRLTSGSPASFTVTASTRTGGNWLSVSPSSGTTPANVTISVNPAGLDPGRYSGTIQVVGPQNTLAGDVELDIAPPPRLSIKPVVPLVFSAQAGDPRSQGGVLQVNVKDPNLSISVQGDSGASWLNVSQKPLSDIVVTATAANLKPGTYTATITVTSSLIAGTAQARVTFYVWDPASPPPLTVTPASLSFTAVSSRAAPPQDLKIDTGAIPTVVGVRSSPSYPPGWLRVSSAGQFAPFTETLAADAAGLFPGIYHGSITLLGPGQNVVVPVTFTVTPELGVPPAIGSIVNAASGAQGAIFPGETISIHGIGVGPVTPAALDASQAAISLGGVEVLFDSKAAPLVYASVSRLDVIVPNEVASETAAIVEVRYNGAKSAAWGIPVAPAPGQ